MRQAIRGVIGILGIVLISALFLPLEVSAAIPGYIDGSTFSGETSGITTENAIDAQTVITEEATQPKIVADSCWIYIGGTWIYVCNHDDAPIKPL